MVRILTNLATKSFMALPDGAKDPRIKHCRITPDFLVPLLALGIRREAVQTGCRVCTAWN